jgi:hypothetical protein
MDICKEIRVILTVDGIIVVAFPALSRRYSNIVWSSLESYGKFVGAIMGIINGKHVAINEFMSLLKKKNPLP